MADPEKATIRVQKSDKERLKEIADATGMNVADVVAEFLREPAYVCPECGEPFDPAEVDPETVEEYGMLTTGMDKLVKGQREVKHFDCPCCSETVRPEDIEAVEADKRSGITRSEMGVTEEAEEAEFSSEEA
jgi:predicted RNA-binding Zn-ribbon protein involved in translation (DUF1610 family)